MNEESRCVDCGKQVTTMTIEFRGVKTPPLCDSCFNKRMDKVLPTNKRRGKP